MERKLFVSHSSKDTVYVDLFVDLLRDLGLNKEEIFYSSNIDLGVKPGEMIFDTLKKELQAVPVVLYFLSKNYYESVACLNEMGASWVLTNRHYPVALPGFSYNEIEGAISEGRLTVIFDKDIDLDKIYSTVEAIFKDVKGFSLTESESLKQVIKNTYIKPFCNQVKKMIRLEKCLLPDEDGKFKLVLGKERIIPDKSKGERVCFELPGLIHPSRLGLDDLKKNESHCLAFFEKQGVYMEGDMVSFSISQEEGIKKYSEFSKEKIRNIFPEKIEKVNI